jgi:hypothetical protein
MPRNNLAGPYHWGESQRLTVRLTHRDLADLDELTELWGLDRSAAVRRVLQQAATAARRQQRDALLAALPGMKGAALRSLARRLHIAGHSRMKADELRSALRFTIARRAAGDSQQ